MGAAWHPRLIALRTLRQPKPPRPTMGVTSTPRFTPGTIGPAGSATRDLITPSLPSTCYAPVQSRTHRDGFLGRVKDRRREQDNSSEDPVVQGVEPDELEGKRGDDKHHPDGTIDPKV